jgi:hypothetical protein
MKLTIVYNKLGIIKISWGVNLSLISFKSNLEAYFHNLKPT